MKPAHRLPAAVAALALALAVLAGASVAAVWAASNGPERIALAAVLAPKAMLLVMIWLAAFSLAAWSLATLRRRHVDAPARLLVPRHRGRRPAPSLFPFEMSHQKTTMRRSVEVCRPLSAFRKLSVRGAAQDSVHAADQRRMFSTEVFRW